MTPEINNYIEKRYERWLEFSKYECAKAGIPDETVDVVNEVIIQLSKKDEDLLRLCRTPSKCGRYKELDVLVLRMVYLNIFSPTAPYQFKNKPIPRANKDLMRLNIADNTEEENDCSGRIFSQFEQVREAFETLNLSPRAKRIFTHRFINGDPFCDWQGCETKKQLYEIYNKVIELIKKKIEKKTLI
jgi:hypothetical protein